ncbi:MAG TPA: histidine phosphatase family protein [Actinomycetaceae bacterium]|nr:histidine phosphatase family protein [Actinomycetaceae bacterium]
MRLILVRHGQTTSNVIHALDTGEPGAGLTTLGHTQAQDLVGKMSGLDISLLVTSNLLRTQQTAAPLAGALGMRPMVDSRIREILAGHLEMRNDIESISEYHTTLLGWMAGDHDVRIPGAEDGHEVLGRFDDAVEAARSEVGDGLAVFVTHGAIIRTWTSLRATNIPDDWGIEHVLRNTDWVELRDGDGRWAIEQWHGIRVSIDELAAEARDRAGQRH